MTFRVLSGIRAAINAALAGPIGDGGDFDDQDGLDMEAALAWTDGQDVRDDEMQALRDALATVRAELAEQIACKVALSEDLVAANDDRAHMRLVVAAAPHGREGTGGVVDDTLRDKETLMQTVDEDDPVLVQMPESYTVGLMFDRDDARAIVKADAQLVDNFLPIGSPAWARLVSKARKLLAMPEKPGGGT